MIIIEYTNIGRRAQNQDFCSLQKKLEGAKPYILLQMAWVVTLMDLLLQKLQQKR